MRIPLHSAELWELHSNSVAPLRFVMAGRNGEALPVGGIVVEREMVVYSNVGILGSQHQLQHLSQSCYVDLHIMSL